jgi:hypothetical protein
MNDIQEGKLPHEDLIDGELKAQHVRVTKVDGEDSGNHVPLIENSGDLHSKTAEGEGSRNQEGRFQRYWNQLKGLFPEDPLSRISRSYQPLFALFGVALLAAAVLTARPLGNVYFMPQFMGLTLILFAMLKLFDLGAFKADFAEYDLITMRWSVYGYWYPLFELFLGLGFLSGLWIGVFSFLTVIMMSITAVGILLVLIHGKEIWSAGGSERASWSLATVSLFESIGLSVIALILFARAL